MVTYQLEWRKGEHQGWVTYGPPCADSRTAESTAAYANRKDDEQMRVVGISTELQPDGTIIRRELSPEELSAAIRGEQVEPKKVKSVVVVSDAAGADAIYVDGILFRWCSCDDMMHATDYAEATGGVPVTIAAHVMDGIVEAWPDRVEDLQIDD